MCISGVRDPWMSWPMRPIRNERLREYWVMSSLRAVARHGRVRSGGRTHRVFFAEVVHMDFVRLASGCCGDCGDDAGRGGEDGDRDPGVGARPLNRGGDGGGEAGEREPDLGSDGHSREPYTSVEHLP